MVYIEHPAGKKLLWDTGVPRDWEKRWSPTGLDQFFSVDSVTEDMWLDSRLKQLERSARHQPSRVAITAGSEV